MSSAAPSASSAPIAALLHSRLLSAFGADAHVALVDESHKHTRGLETHFAVAVVSAAFAGMPLLARHRAVMEAARGGAGGELPVHALSIRAHTPAQWEAAGAVVQATPPCRGGDGGGRG